MIYRVIYRNPNDIYVDTRTFETRKRWEFNSFLKDAKEYQGSYVILSIEKISEKKQSTSLKSPSLRSNI
jgi:hypothetical protein